MPVREVVLNRDVRAPNALMPGALASHYNLKRAARAALLLLLDVAALAFALVTAHSLWDSFGVGILEPSLTEKLVAGLIIILTMAAFGLYRSRSLRRGMVPVWQASLVSLIVIGIAMMIGTHSVTPKSVVLTWLLFVAADTVLRGVSYAILRRASPIPHRRPALVIGRPDRCERSAELLTSSADGGELSSVGAVIDGPVPDGWRERTGLRALGSLDGLEEIIDRQQPTDLILGDPELIRDRLRSILDVARSHNLTVHMAAPDMGFEGAPVCYVPGFGMPVFVVEESRASCRGFRVKRALDLTLALLALLLLAPLLLAVALAIKLTSHGPVLYASERVGLGQRRFHCLKFRTMYADADVRQVDLEAMNEADGAIFKIRDDPRITPIGRFLRKTSLDEMPQLINVIRGEMSLVGPRPLPMRDNDLMEDWHKHRHVVLPGLTGLWQISGRSELSFDQMIELDLRYIENWSLRSDLAIMGRTIGVILFGRGAY